MDRILAACGNDCSACPRYTAHPYEKSEEELHRTADLWMKIGYRDHVVSNEEIACTGLFRDNAGGHDAEHTLRVYRNAMRIAESEPA